MILPLALVSVGGAQELNCWGLRATKIEEEEPSGHSSMSSCSDTEKTEEWADGSCCHMDNESEDENSSREL